MKSVLHNIYTFISICLYYSSSIILCSCSWFLSLDLEDIIPPKRRRVPARYEEGSRDSYHEDPDAVSYCRREYYTSIDTTVGTIKNRFQQDGLKIYDDLVSALFCAIRGDSVSLSTDVQRLYGDDFNIEQLKGQLDLVATLLKDGPPVHSVKAFGDWLKASESRNYLGQVELLTSLVLTMPATNAVSERSFSALKRVKTYLRNSMGQARMNSLLLLHTYPNRADSIEPKAVIRDYVAGHTDRCKRIGDSGGN